VNIKVPGFTLLLQEEQHENEVGEEGMEMDEEEGAEGETTSTSR
jgi:hypothetical protein